VRIWDIVDRIDPGTTIVVETKPNKHRLRGIASSAAHCVFAVGLVVASAGTFDVKRPACGSNYTPNLRVQVLGEEFMSLEVAETLSAMRQHRFDADVANQEPEDEEPIGYSYPT
jgi:hypothetical protein